MSLYDYNQSIRASGEGYGFQALIMAAMRQADSFNAAYLRSAFPEIWDELQQRYNAPGGLLPDEVMAEDGVG